MVDLASRVMLGEKLANLGYGVGLYRIPPYTAVKVPVFSFEKLNDANSTMGPQMKSTGEVLGVGRTLTEALYKGLVSAGFRSATRRAARSGSAACFCPWRPRTWPKPCRWPKNSWIWGLRYTPPRARAAR